MADRSASLPALPATRSDPELIQAFLQGDRSARDRVLAAWAPTVLAWCMRLGGPRVDAHDAAQDVLEVVVTRGQLCREPGAFPAWVWGVTRKVLGRHRTRAWVRYWVGGAVPDRADGALGPRARAEISETGKRVQGVMEALPQEMRELLVLHDAEGRSATEVGLLLGIPAGTVKSRVRRAREEFRKQADDRGLAVPLVDAVQGGLGH